ncbi:hypothetical protein GCM10023322_02030 [Rugosimonospora acidiphila]|uniref:NlpC/P60 domain-containing protein n=1 Tax=Rugosimonospora acidiphila TaxID=556531 RepID=A0ABP9RHS4_9ACTN
MLVCSVVCVLIARPSFAAPADANPGQNPPSTATIPDTGVAPISGSPLTPPGSAQAGSGLTPVTGPYASQITAQYATLEATGEKLKEANFDLDNAKQDANSTYQVWQQAIKNAAETQTKADNLAAQAYEDAAGLGPLANFASDVHQLGMLAPGLNAGGSQTGSVAAAQDATEARKEAATDEEAYRAALAHEQELESQQNSLQSSYNQQNTTLTSLQTTNATQIEAAEAAQAASDQQLDPEFGAGTQVNGRVANPKALAALRWAYAQATANPPKWYKFGAEGPNFFDCSGLTWASYRSTGYTLPRVAADQFHATSVSEVPPSQLLPGDLLFFSTTSKTDWTTISHVAIYYGDNLMVEAAHEGTPVRVSQVWWSAFYGATRVYPAVGAPTPTQSASPTPSKTPSPTPSKTSSPNPHPSKTPSAPPSGSSPSPSSSPSSSPSPTSSPSKSPTPPPASPSRPPVAPPPSSGGSTIGSPSPSTSESESGTASASASQSGPA